MKLLTIIIAIVILTSCSAQKKARYVCDSGFKTPWIAYHKTGMNKDIIWWKQAELRFSRKMSDNEICYKETLDATS